MTAGLIIDVSVMFFRRFLHCHAVLCPLCSVVLYFVIFVTEIFSLGIEDDFRMRRDTK